MSKVIVALLCGHHGIGTGATFKDRDEWVLVREDICELYLQLKHDEIMQPVVEPIREDSDPREQKSHLRSARWAMSQKADAAIELHYNSYTSTSPTGHLIVSNRMTPFVTCMADALDVLPNRRRDTIINAGFILPRLLDAQDIPCVLLEPAFIFEPIVGTPEWRPMLVAAIKQGLYKYFAGGE